MICLLARANWLKDSVQYRLPETRPGRGQVSPEGDGAHQFASNHLGDGFALGGEELQAILLTPNHHYLGAMDLLWSNPFNGFGLGQPMLRT